MEPIKILIADDHQLILDGVSNLIRKEKDIEIVGTANNGVEALNILQSGKVVNVAVLDINMEPMNGIDVTRRIREDNIDTKILILSLHRKKDQLEALMKLDVEGYILKGGRGIVELLEAIRTIANGRQYFGRQLVDVAFEAHKEILKKSNEKEIVLTKREKEIVGMFAKSLNAREIAKKLFLSAYTVETHRKNIYTKLGINNNAQLVRYAIEHGLD